MSPEKKLLVMVNELIGGEVRVALTEWEEEFVDSLYYQLSDGKPLTDGQRAKLQDIYDEKVEGY